MRATQTPRKIPARAANHETSVVTPTGRTPERAIGQHPLDADPQHDTHQGAHEGEHRRLEQVCGEEALLASPQTAENRHRHHLLTDVDVDGTGHSDAAEEEGRQGR